MKEKDIRVDRRRLETLMELKGFDNESLAKAMGKHYNSIIRLKQEQSTTFANLEILCDVLECHPFDLIVAAGYPKPFSVALVSHWRLSTNSVDAARARRVFSMAIPSDVIRTRHSLLPPSTSLAVSQKQKTPKFNIEIQKIYRS